MNRLSHNNLIYVILSVVFCVNATVVVYVSNCRPAPIKVGACRALAQLFEHVNVSSLRTHLGPVYAALAKLLQEVGFTSHTIGYAT